MGKRRRILYGFVISLCLFFMPALPATAQRVAYSTLYHQGNFSRSIDLSRPVGTIDGTAVVTASGAASYTIPVKCPTGTNGMVPDLSLVYNAQSGNGVLGMGWSISGLSVIARAGKDQYHDHTTAAVTYTNKDAFVLDGQRLSVTSGSNGTNGSTYRTESESYAVVTANGSYGTGGGPEWFRVLTKDGTVMEYGNTADARTLTNEGQAVMIWRLNRIQDIHGNYLTFRYTVSNDGADPADGNKGRDCQLAEILYTGNVHTRLKPYNRLNFSYGVRGDKNTLYSGGNTIESRYVLTGITITGEGGAPFKSYAFSYANETGRYGNTPTWLKSVEERSGSSALNTTVFKYGEQPAAFTVDTADIPVALSDANSIYAGEYTGDGIADILRSTGRGGSYTIYKKETAGYVVHGSTSIIPAALIYGRGYLSATSNRGFVPSDYNGDNMDDILGVKAEWRGIPTPRGIVFLQFYAGVVIRYPADGSSTMTEDSIGAPTGIATLFQDKELIPGDFDGDQRMDYFNVLNALKPGPEDYYLSVTFPKKGIHNKVIVHTGSGTMDHATAFRVAAADQVFVIDYDGDGRSEIMITDDDYYRVYRFKELPSGDYALEETGSGGYPTGAYHKILGLGDFNDDGITDLITRQKVAPYGVEIGYGTGKGFAGAGITFQHSYEETCSLGSRTAKGDDVYVADFNGDGRSDIFHLKRNCNGLYDTRTNFDVYYSTGTGFSYKTYDYGARVAEEVKPCVGDFNGDGKADLAFAIDDRAGPETKLRLLFFGKDGKERLLEQVTDGFNRTTRFEYETIARGGAGFYTKGTGAAYPVNNVQLTAYVVTAMQQPDGIGGTATTRYDYVNQLWHRGGKGFLGFERIRSRAENTGVQTESVYGLYAPLQLPYLAGTRTTQLATAMELSRTEYQYQFNNSGWLYAQQCTGSVSVDLMKGKAATSIRNTFDNWGNITNNVTRVNAIDIESETVTTTSTYIAAGSAIPNKPSAIAVTRKRGIRDAVTKPVTISYRPNGLVWQYREFPAGTNAAYSEYDYDAYGNKTYETRKPNDPASVYAPFSPATTYTYDPKGRFVTGSVNALGHSTTTSWHPLWGKPLQETTVSGVVTEYEYDDWGRLQKTKYPGPYELTRAVSWGTSPGVLYATLEQDPGAPDERNDYDLLERVVKTATEAFGGGWAQVNTRYNNKGQVVSSTNKHLVSETPLTTINTYDIYGQLKTSTNDFGTTTYDHVYDRGLITTTVINPAGQQRSTRKDAMGRILETKDNGGTLKFNYDSWGNPLLTTNGHTVYLSREYNEQGQLVREDDQDAGRTIYAYNPFGVQIAETDGEGNITRLEYLDKLGRLTRKAVGAYTTTYQYHGPAKGNTLAEASTTGPDGLIIDSTDYNSKGELIREWRSAAGFSLEKNYSYDIYGQLSTTAYSSGLKLRRIYDDNGYLERIQTAPAGEATRTLFKAVSRNGMGQYTHFIRDNGEGSSADYYHGIPTRYYTPGLQDLNLRYDYANGNLLERRDLNRGLKETFTYDKLDRLVTSVVDGPGGILPAINIDYDRPPWGSRGNITAKTDAGKYRYSANKVVEINHPEPAISHALQTIAYKPFRKAELIREPKPGSGLLQEQSYSYNGEQERVYSRFAEGSLLKEQRWYSGELERQVLAGASGRFIHYIEGGGQLTAIVISEAGSHTYYTVYTDHLGSVVKVTDETGREVADLDYNAWGRERKAINWDYPASGTIAGARPSWLYRGYTGHEMLPQFGLIDMNGRMYDPVNGRMLRPDSYIQDPLNTQNYNRYTYCLNNPLKYTDPSGDQYVGLSNYGSAYSYAGTYNSIPYTASYNHSFYVFNNSYSAKVHNGYTTTTYHNWIAGTEAFNSSYGPWSAAYSRSFKTGFSSTFFTIGPPVETAAETYAAYSYHASTPVIARIEHKPTFDGIPWNQSSFGRAVDEFFINVNPATALPNFFSKLFTGKSIQGYEMEPGSLLELAGPPVGRAGAAAAGVEKAVVIGEGMYRVKPAARFVNAKWYQAWSKNFPSGGLMTETELNAAKAVNARWLNAKINQGYKIYDIGPKGPHIASPFYQLERDIIKKTGYRTTPLLGF